MTIEYQSVEMEAPERFSGDLRVTRDGDAYLTADDSKERVVLLFHVKHPKGRSAIQPFVIVVVDASISEREALRNIGVRFESERGDLFG